MICKNTLRFKHFLQAYVAKGNKKRQKRDKCLYKFLLKKINYSCFYHLNDLCFAQNFLIEIYFTWHKCGWHVCWVCVTKTPAQQTNLLASTCQIYRLICCIFLSVLLAHASMVHLQLLLRVPYVTHVKNNYNILFLSFF